MTEREFLERFIFLAQKLCDVTNDDGYGSDAYYAVLDEVQELGKSFKGSHRVSPWIRNFAYIAAILFVLYLVYCLLAEAFEWGR